MKKTNLAALVILIILIFFTLIPFPEEVVKIERDNSETVAEQEFISFEKIKLNNIYRTSNLFEDKTVIVEEVPEEIIEVEEEKIISGRLVFTGKVEIGGVSNYLIKDTQSSGPSLFISRENGDSGWEYFEMIDNLLILTKDDKKYSVQID